MQEGHIQGKTTRPGAPIFRYCKSRSRDCCWREFSTFNQLESDRNSLCRDPTLWNDAYFQEFGLCDLRWFAGIAAAVIRTIIAEHASAEKMSIHFIDTCRRLAWYDHAFGSISFNLWRRCNLARFVADVCVRVPDNPILRNGQKTQGLNVKGARKHHNESTSGRCSTRAKQRFIKSLASCETCTKEVTVTSKQHKNKDSHNHFVIPWDSKGMSNRRLLRATWCLPVKWSVSVTTIRQPLSYNLQHLLLTHSIAERLHTYIYMSDCACKTKARDNTHQRAFDKTWCRQTRRRPS